MPARDLRQKRKKWRNNTLTYRRKKRILQAALDNSPPKSEIDVPLSSEERTLLTSTPSNSKIKGSFSTCNVLPIPKELGSSTSETFSNSLSINEAPKSRHKKQGQKAVRRDRSKIYRENLKLRKENAKLKRKMEAIRKNTVNPDLRATWKWPQKPDTMEYSKEDIVKKISQPVPCGSCLRLTFYFSDEIFQTN